jgi:hypothetical protein
MLALAALATVAIALVASPLGQGFLGVIDDALHLLRYWLSGLF